MERIEGAKEVMLSEVVGFFGDHAISTPNKSRLRARLLADRRILAGSTSNQVRVREAELSRLDDELGPLFRPSQPADSAELAGIEYHGVAGSSIDCECALLRLLQCRAGIVLARILTSGNRHCLLLRTEIGDQIAIKSGFSSGYGGEGPRRLATVLKALRSQDVDIDECEVLGQIIERVDMSALTVADLDDVTTAQAVRPSRWADYFEPYADDRFWLEYPLVLPLAILDSRIRDLAVKFWDSPDDALLKGYRRLEDAVRIRTGIKEHGAKPFAKAFHPTSGQLRWMEITDGECTGRGQLFIASFMAHRNPRAHREIHGDCSEQLSEFLLLNHLFRLEREACFSQVEAA
jgi:hypothetical protein